jgi:ketosteroid isomerase-like protein
MSQENVETLHSAYRAISRGDWDAAFEEAEPDLNSFRPNSPRAVHL